MQSNSTKKGDAFEKIIFDILSIEIENDRFFVRKEACKIFRQKKYYSKDRQGYIKFDITVEVYIPGRENYSILIVIECKIIAMQFK